MPLAPQLKVSALEIAMNQGLSPPQYARPGPCYSKENLEQFSLCVMDISSQRLSSDLVCHVSLLCTRGQAIGSGWV
jgi:hypothetical protein